MNLSANNYEAQLSPEELQSLHLALGKPGANLVQIQADSPPWRDGRFAGEKPALKTFYNIATRLRSEAYLAEIEETASSSNWPATK